MTTKSGKHANKTSGSAKDKAAKVVDMRKVAALSAGAAGVIAGAAIAFGATPAMAAEDGTAAPVNTNDPAKEQNLVDANKGNSKTSDDSKATKKNEASKDETTNSEVKKEAKKEESKEEPKKEQTKPAEQSVAKTDGNTDVTKTETGSKVESTASVDNQDAKQDSEETGTHAGSVVNKRTRRSLGEKKQPEPTKDAKVENQNRDASGTTNQDPNKIKPNTTDTTNTKIDINENNAGTMPNAYAWGSSDNTYSVDGEKHTVTFNFAKPTNGGTITSIAIFPARTNGFNNEKSERGIDFYSKDPNKHQAYSGEYIFTAKDDGSATLEMSTLFRNGNIGAAEKYAAARSIFVYVTKDGTTTVYKTNVFRAETLVPPKTSGSVVLKYNEQLTPEKVQAAITAAANAATTRSDKMSVNDQIVAASKAKGVFTIVDGKSTQVADTLDGKLNVRSSDAYDAKQFKDINTETSASGAKDKTYVAGAKTLNTYMVTDLGFKSEAIPLTVARYDTRIDKPIVDEVDFTKLTDDQKADICKKLAQLNHVAQDKVKFNDKGEAVISFDGVEAKDAPRIALKDLVLKKLAEKDITVPANDKATVIYNPLGYSDAEIARIKKSIYDANKDNDKLGLSADDYENQITLEYLKGNLTATGDSNKGISNGQQENAITVKIKTDKAVAEFKSDVKSSKLTRLPDIRKDYTVSWTKDKIDGRDTDEGISWSEDKKTIIYRYDPTKAQEFDTTKILNLLKATPNDKQAGLRELTGGETLDHEGNAGKATKSHVGYVLKDDKPTNELTLGNMSSAYWQYKQNVSNSGVNLGDAEANAGSYSWDEDAKPVFVAGKKGKIYKARLFVLPYTMTFYRNIYIENGKQPWNTPKAINVIFVPQTNHKKSDLEKSIEGHKTTKIEGKDVPTESKYYNASDKKKNAYDEALTQAKKALEQAGDTEDSKLAENLKALIDNATINLNKARAELDGDKTNKDQLTQSINENGKAAEGSTPATAGTVTTDKYKNVTNPDFKDADGNADTAKNNAAKKAKEDYDKALEDANKVNDDANATQKAVDDAKAKLDAARKELDKYSTNKDELNAAIAVEGKVNTGDPTKQGDEKLKTADPSYQNSTKEEREAYDKAVAQANDLAKDPNASQKEVNEAITALQKAKAALDAKATDKSKLAAAEKQSFDNPKPDDASKQSVFYKNAKNKKDNGASEPEKQAAAKAVQDYDDALAKAREVLNNEKATQAQVDEAKQKLESAEAALHADTYATDKTDLGKALADNFSGYLMPAYFNAFDKAQKDGKDSQAAKDFKAYNDAYHAAKDLMEKLKQPGSTITQTEADKIKDQLIAARKIIDTYATDTSKLSAAAFNDIAIKLSPAYKNVSANDASEEAKAAKKKYDEAVEKLHKALNNQLPKDQAAGADIPDSNIPDKDGDLTDKNYLKNIQAHKNGEPLDRDVTAILKEMNDAAKALDKFATKTDELIKSINKDSDTHPSPAFKNASQPVFQKSDSADPDATKNAAATAAANKYGEMLNKAKDLLKDPTATQAQVNEAKKNLDDARKELDKYKTDTTKLKASVDKHGSTDTGTTEGTVTSDAYRNASDPHFMKADATDPTKLVEDTQKNDEAKKDKTAYDKALAKAQELLKKHDAEDTPQDAKPTQKEINDALKALDDARTKLDTYKTDTSKLDEEAKKSQADGAQTPADTDFEATPEFKNATYKQGVKPDTDPDVQQAKSDLETYKKALKDARDLLAKKDADKLSERPTQKQIDDALETLKQAKQAITDGYKTKTDKLTEAKDYANGDFKKTPEYKNADAIKGDDANAKHEQAAKDVDGTNDKPGLNKLIEKITQKLQNANNLTQREVDALLKQLKSAQKKIADNYKTNADKLKNEVGDKDQDGKPIVPAFEASVPYKNALEKAKTEENKTDPNSATKKLEEYNKKLKAAQDLIAQVNSTDPNADPNKKPTQAQVDQALQELKDAKTAIADAFKTNASALRTETKELNNDGTSKDDKDKFENSTEYKNALAKKTGEEDIPDVKDYKEALKKANELLNKFGDDGKPKQGEKDIPTQQEVDEAQKALKEIKDKILANYKTSPHDLQDEVDKSKDGDTDTDTSTDLFENTPAFKNAQAKGDDAAKQALEDYNKKLQAAKDLLAKFDRKTGKLKQGETAPTQKQLDDALDALQAAKKKIEDNYSTVKSDLRQEAGKDSDFTKSPEYQNAQAKGDDASKKALEDYKKALEDANKVLGDKNATQADVDAALKKLQDAKSKLSDGYKTDKSDLTAEAGKDSDFTKSPEYQNAAGSPEAEAYKKALEDANKVLGDKNATQAQVDDALRKLQDAKKKLADSHKTDKSDLNTEAGKDPDFRKSIPFIIGKAADLAEYQQALNDADSVLNNPNATQAQVDQALRRLRDAKQKLIDSYNRLINSGSGVGSGSDHDFGTDTDVNTGVGVNDVNNTSVNNVVDKGALQAEVDAALGDVSANANGVVADSNLVSEFNAALNYARLVLADANATQGQVDSALARLRAARAALRAGMLAARNSAGMNLKRGDVSGVNTGASSSVFAALAAVFAGLGVVGAASKRRKHSAR